MPYRAAQLGDIQEMDTMTHTTIHNRVTLQPSEARSNRRPHSRHSRAGGNPGIRVDRLDSRLRGNDVLQTAEVLPVYVHVLRPVGNSFLPAERIHARNLQARRANECVESAVGNLDRALAPSKTHLLALRTCRTHLLAPRACIASREITSSIEFNTGEVVAHS